MGKQINVQINDIIILIDSDTPNFDDLVKTVIEMKGYDFNKMVVTCTDDSFDTETFKNSLLNVITSVVQGLDIEKEKLARLLEEIEEKKKEYKWYFFNWFIQAYRILINGTWLVFQLCWDTGFLFCKHSPMGGVIGDINGGCAYLIINNEVGYVCALGDA